MIVELDVVVTLVLCENELSLSTKTVLRDFVTVLVKVLAVLNVLYAFAIPERVSMYLNQANTKTLVVPKMKLPSQAILID